jgi:3-phenylpropionate/trans-cinnamate dioxygenase ferredoxin component
MAQWVAVARADEIPRGQFMLADVGGAMVAVFHLDGGFFAVDDLCTHDGGSLSGGTVEGDEVVCPRHGARFNVRSGAVTEPPAVEPVHVFPVRERDGAVEVMDDRWDGPP